MFDIADVNAFEIDSNSLTARDGDRRFAVKVVFNGIRNPDGGGTGAAHATHRDLWIPGKQCVVEDFGADRSKILDAISEKLGHDFGFAAVGDNGGKTKLAVEITGYGILLSDSSGREVATLEVHAGASNLGEIRSTIPHTKEGAPSISSATSWGGAMRFLNGHGIVELHARKRSHHASDEAVAA